MRTAIVHDWLVSFGGAERVLEQMLHVTTDADLFCLLADLPRQHRDRLQPLYKTLHTTWLRHLPAVSRLYRYYLPLMPTAIESLDLSDYDVVLSSSHAVARGVLTSYRQKHICYLHSESLRYMYDHRGLYLSSNPILQWVQNYLYTGLRMWDHAAAQRPDVYVANSHYTADWHRHRYGVNINHVIYPPVDTEFFGRHYSDQKDSYYVVVARLEPSKRIDLLIQSIKRLRRRLIVVGDGTQRSQLESLAEGGDITFTGALEREAIAQMLSQAACLVFPCQEAFGIAAAEAQATGTPIITYKHGGTAEIIRSSDADTDVDGAYGLLFDRQDVDCLVDAIERFERRQSSDDPILPQLCRSNAARFSVERFRQEMRAVLTDA